MESHHQSLRAELFSENLAAELMQTSGRKRQCTVKVGKINVLFLYLDCQVREAPD